MFNGDQFHQFIASRTSLPIPLSPFPLHGNPSFSPGFGNPSFSSGFDPYRSSEELQQLHQESQSHNNKISTSNNTNNSVEDKQLGEEREKSLDSSWSSDEVFLLLKVRSSIENWYPDFSWEHVSRKLGELGSKRTAEECKEKYEEESGNVSYGKNYRILSELDELYPGGNQEEARVSAERVETDQVTEKRDEGEREEMNVEENSGNVAVIPSEEMSEEVVTKPPPEKSNKKRKRKEKFEMLKGYCVAIVNKMMAQQEELHNKLIEDIVKRDEEIIAREEAWKNKEMDRTKMEIEKWTKEQAVASERQNLIIEFLKKHVSTDDEFATRIENLGKTTDSLTGTTLDALAGTTLLYDRTPTTGNSLPRSKLEPIRKIQEQPHEAKTAGVDPNPQNQESVTITPPRDQSLFPNVATNSSKANSSSNTTSLVSSDYDDRKGDLGMRWPRDQVLALINLRCKFSNNSTTSHGEEAACKGPLWERISQGMIELGYKRSAKRCKEKWENINKYYRKTKDSNKKRSADSRTCPYFHELSRLYNEGTLVAPNNE